MVLLKIVYFHYELRTRREELRLELLRVCVKSTFCVLKKGYKTGIWEQRTDNYGTRREGSVYQGYTYFVYSLCSKCSIIIIILVSKR